jgi:hypothetical protein
LERYRRARSGSAVALPVRFGGVSEPGRFQLGVFLSVLKKGAGQGRRSSHIPWRRHSQKALYAPTSYEIEPPISTLRVDFPARIRPARRYSGVAHQALALQDRTTPTQCFFFAPSKTPFAGLSAVLSAASRRKCKTRTPCSLYGVRPQVKILFGVWSVGFRV